MGGQPVLPYLKAGELSSMRVRIRVALSLGKVLTQGRKDEANAVAKKKNLGKVKDQKKGCPRGPLAEENSV